MLTGHLKWEEDFRQLYDKMKNESQEPEAESEEEEEERKRNREADMRQFVELENRIKQSVRNIVRYFHTNRQMFDKVKDIIGHKRGGKIGEFPMLFAIQYEIFKQKMTTSKEEDDSKAEMLEQLEEKV